MEEKFNILEFLRYAPQNLELYCPICGSVKLIEVNDKEIIVNYFKQHTGSPATVHEIVFDEYGHYYDYMTGECMLFPSEDIRDWRFAPQFLLPKSIGSVVVLGNGFSAICGKNKLYRMYNGDMYPSIHYDCFDWNDCIGEIRYATPEEYNDFFVLLDGAGYKFNEDGIIEPTWEPQNGDTVAKKDDSSQLFHLIKNDGFGFNYVITSAFDNASPIGGGGPLSADDIRKRFRLVTRLETPEEYIERFFNEEIKKKVIEFEQNSDEDSLSKKFDELADNFEAMLDLKEISNNSLISALKDAYQKGLKDGYFLNN
jgi:hypothetical protein